MQTSLKFLIILLIPHMSLCMTSEAIKNSTVIINKNKAIIGNMTIINKLPQRTPISSYLDLAKQVIENQNLDINKTSNLIIAKSSSMNPRFSRPSKHEQKILNWWFLYDDGDDYDAIKIAAIYTYAKAQM